MRTMFQCMAQTLFAIEGTGQTGLGANFGDGYNTASAASGAAANPNPFFQELLTKPYRGDALCTLNSTGCALGHGRAALCLLCHTDASSDTNNKSPIS